MKRNAKINYKKGDKTVDLIKKQKERGSVQHDRYEYKYLKIQKGEMTATLNMPLKPKTQN